MWNKTTHHSRKRLCNKKPTTTRTNTRSSACDPINGTWEGTFPVGGSCDSECTAAGFVKGDPTYNGNIDVLDIIELRNFILDPVPFSNHDMPPFYNYWPCVIWAMDINNDRNIDVIDIQSFVNMILDNTGGGVGEELRVLQINAGHLSNINYDNVYDSLPDFPECLDACTQQGLCRRSYENTLLDFISQAQPDIVTITELISQDECNTNGTCQQLHDVENSSCFQPNTYGEQIDRVLPGNYTYSCTIY